MGDEALLLVGDMPEQQLSTQALFTDHHERIFLAAYRVSGSVQDAEDVLQSIFLRLLQEKERAKIGINPESYLCRAAINASLDLVRTRGRRQMVDLDEREDEIDSEAPPTDIDVYRSEQRHRIRAAMMTLNSREAEIFALRHFEDFRNSQIADLLDTSVSSVAVTLHRAREKLQSQLREYEGETK